MLYNKFSDYLVRTYNEKVYKIPVNLPATCQTGMACWALMDVFLREEVQDLKTFHPICP